MDEPATTFAIIAAYSDLALAREDFAAVEDLATAHELHLDDAVLLRHSGEGGVEVVLHDARSVARGAEGGVIVGALVGLMFPPALVGMLVGAAAVGGIGAAVGNLWHGFSRRELTELGDAVEEGEAAIVAIGSEAFAGEVEQAVPNATRIVLQSVGVDRGKLRRVAVGSQ
jgi:uncharacterized membrane protein